MALGTAFAVGYIVVLIIMNIIGIFMMGLFLWLSGRIFSMKRNKYWTAVLVSFLLMAFSALFTLLGTAIGGRVGVLLMIPFLFLVWFVAPWLLIKLVYKDSWGKTFLIWLVWAVFSTVAWVILTVIVYAILAIIGISALALAAGAAV